MHRTTRLEPFRPPAPTHEFVELAQFGVQLPGRFGDSDHVSCFGSMNVAHRFDSPRSQTLEFSKWTPAGCLLDVLISPDLVVCQRPICNL
jgi:hypothetical protein